MEMKYIFIFLMVMLTMIGCKDMDSTYKEYVVVGGIVYPGKIIKPTINSGYNKVLISGKRGSDPSVTYARIFWNNYTDSIEVPVPQGTDSISKIIDNLPENTYSFFIHTYDKKGNVSVPVEVLGRVYGESYVQGLSNRYLKYALADNSNTVQILWGDADLTSGAISTEIQYTDNSNQQQVKFCKTTKNNLLLENYKPGTTFKYRTMFVPDSTCIDTFYTSFDVQKVLVNIDKSEWAATTDSYEATGQLPNGGPEKTIDGDVNTYWHTQHSGGMPGYPHWLAYDMKKTVGVAIIELTSRSNFYTADFTKFTIQKSTDGINWTDCESFVLAEKIGTQSFVLQNPPVTRYLRIYMNEGTQPYSHLAEFSVIGTYEN